MSWLATLHTADAADRRPGHNDPMGSTGFSLDKTEPGGGPCATWAGLGSSGPDRPVRVLVVDDDCRVRTAIGQTIALEGDLVMVAEAADATTALALAERAGPAVALVDLLLPEDTTGLGLVASLARRPGWAVVAMSVRSSLRAAARAAGAVAFVEKGGDIDAILNAVRAAAPPHRV
jgi:DNA-binding NtrC family response regulator